MTTNDILPADKRNLRLNALPVTSLPPHPTFSDVQTSSADLKTFVNSYLQEAFHMANTMIPKHFKPVGGLRKSSPSTAQVQMAQCDVLKPDTWFVRSSTHEDKVEVGTASWKEFEDALHYNHSLNEAEYTPDIYDARCIVDWSEGIQELGQGAFGEDIKDVQMGVWEMAHNLPGGLNHRVFANLVLRALKNSDELIVVQRPIDLAKASAAFYSNGKHVQEGDDKTQKDKVVIGQYTSVERAKKVEGGKILWEMALASDAGGWLPKTVQKMALPGEVAKDPGFVMQWVDDQRHKKAKSKPSE